MLIGEEVYRSKKISAFLLAAFVLLMVSSRGVSAANSSGGNSGNAPLTLAQLLQKTTNTMKRLKSVSYNLNLANSMTVPDLFSISSNSQTLVMTMKGSGVSVLHGDAKVQFSINTGKQNTTINEIVKGQKLYVEKQKGRWYVLSKSTLQGLAFASPDLTSYDGLLTLSNVKIVDDGTTTLDGSSVRHATLIFNKSALNNLLNSTGALNSLPASQKQNMRKLFESMTLKNAVLDVWIDASTAYIHRLQLQFDMGMDMSQLMTPTPGTPSRSLTIESSQNTTIDYNKFNASVTITAPGNATPTDSMLTVFE